MLALNTEVKALRTTQESRATALDQARKAQGGLRQNCAVALYKVVACAMWIWAETPLQVDTLINLLSCAARSKRDPLPPVDTT